LGPNNFFRTPFSNRITNKHRENGITVNVNGSYRQSSKPFTCQHKELNMHQVC
jgi:hypothetical protein